MKQITTFLSMLAMLSCLSCASDGNPSNTDTESPPYQFIPEGADGEFECRAGDYDSNSDGDIDFSIGCYSNGNRKHVILYQTSFTAFYKKPISSIHYTFYESNGQLKTLIRYDSYGIQYGGHPICYQDDGITQETCAPAQHGCDLHYSCADPALYGGGRHDCIAGDYDSNYDTKTDFSITCHNNGARKTYIRYQNDGLTKHYEFTYHEDGNLKESISHSDHPCTGNQILKDEKCTACADPEYPNSDRTACVTTCANGELKPTNKPTCEAKATCTGNKVHNPADNTCITEAACRIATGKLISTDGRACISEDACHGGDSSGENSILDNRCITDEACQDMAGHVAADDGECMECTGDDPIRNVGKTACISYTDCHGGNSSGPNSLLGTDCITDAACQDMPGYVAQLDGVCQECSGDTPLRNTEQTACLSECPDSQFPNSGRTDCASSCPAGEVKPTNKPTCEKIVTCTGDQLYNPEDNTCISL